MTVGRDDYASDAGDPIVMIMSEDLYNANSLYDELYASST